MSAAFQPSMTPTLMLTCNGGTMLPVEALSVQKGGRRLALIPQLLDQREHRRLHALVHVPRGFDKLTPHSPFPSNAPPSKQIASTWLRGPRRRRERGCASYRPPRSGHNGPDRMPTPRARRTHMAHHRRQKVMFSADSLVIAGACISKFASVLMGGRALRAWRTVERLEFTVFVARSADMHGLALEDRLILGVE
ncbi:hypothetical protein BGY98DRAFT_934700 [Russula aff. rugulosa BPL654]|nr:hypothetical protein BGY98DRAFT_934700 [Russula aff. rugulosa BPL654]